MKLQQITFKKHPHFELFQGCVDFKNGYTVKIIISSIVKVRGLSTCEYECETFHSKELVYATTASHQTEDEVNQYLRDVEWLPPKRNRGTMKAAIEEVRRVRKSLEKASSQNTIIFKDHTGRVIERGQQVVMDASQNEYKDWDGHIVEKTVTTQYFKYDYNGDEVEITPETALWIEIK